MERTKLPASELRRCYCLDQNSEGVTAMKSKLTIGYAKEL
jgi:hypothetical protein